MLPLSFAPKARTRYTCVTGGCRLRLQCRTYSAKLLRGEFALLPVRLSPSGGSLHVPQTLLLLFKAFICMRIRLSQNSFVGKRFLCAFLLPGPGQHRFQLLLTHRVGQTHSGSRDHQPFRLIRLCSRCRLLFLTIHLLQRSNRILIFSA